MCTVAASAVVIIAIATDIAAAAVLVERISSGHDLRQDLFFFTSSTVDSRCRICTRTSITVRTAVAVSMVIPQGLVNGVLTHLFHLLIQNFQLCLQHFLFVSCILQFQIEPLDGLLRPPFHDLHFGCEFVDVVVLNLDGFLEG